MFSSIVLSESYITCKHALEVTKLSHGNDISIKRETGEVENIVEEPML
jgi:hypothetical protein